MKQRKPNISRWYLLGLAMILAAGCLIGSVGVVFARYRVQHSFNLTFTPKATAMVTVGINDGGTIQAGLPQWVAVTGTDGETEHYTMDFAIYHDKKDEQSITKTITTKIQIIGTVGSWKGAEGDTVTLYVTENGETKALTAEVTAIEPDTVLYHNFGEGWVFRFLDENGQEITWDLKYSTKNDRGAVLMQIRVDADAINADSLLQLQVIGQWAED